MIDPHVLRRAATFAENLGAYIELVPDGFRIVARDASTNYVAEHVLRYELVQQAHFPVTLFHDEIMRVRRMVA